MPPEWFRSLMSVVTLEAGLIVSAAFVAGRAWPCCLRARHLGRRRVWYACIRGDDVSSTAILLGFQIIYGAFFVSILEIRAARPGEETVPDRSAKAA